MAEVQSINDSLYLICGVALIYIFLLGLVILVYITYTRRKTRLELERGKCNLPTVVWRPRFMNYYTAQDDGTSEDDIDWEDHGCVMEWARKFLEEYNSPQSQVQVQGTAGTIISNDKKKKMGSSSITNILPRMERLNGPYGMYATVYGIQTKVVHVAHPVPARAILTGAGVLEVGGMGDSLGRANSSLRQVFKRTVMNRQAAESISSKDHVQNRRTSSSLRMLTGSTKYPAYDHFKNFSGEGVFTANGSDWKAKRASVMHCLLRNGNTEQSLEMEANRAADSFEREVAYVVSNRSSGGESGSENTSEIKKSPVMNIVPMLQRSTVALIYRLITHHNVDFCPDSVKDEETKKDPPSPRSGSVTSTSSDLSLVSSDETDESTEKRSHSEHVDKDALIKSLLPSYLQSVTKIRMIVLAQSRSFWYLLPRWVYRVFSPMYREEERTMGPIREFAQLACENAMPGSPVALLSQRDSHSEKQDGARNAAGKKISTNISKDLLDEAITLLFAGQDTSAATLSWTLHLLSLHPEKQERVAKEVRSVLCNSEIKPVLKRMISQMPYLDAVIKESMRLYPVAPFIVRKLTSDITIPVDEEHSKTISVPSSTFACIWIYALHRNPKLWEQPDEFLPERWIDPELRSRDSGQTEYGAYMPFAIGPRNCLGQPLAQVILRVLLARILNKYIAIDPKLEALQGLGKADNFDPKCLRKDMQAGFTVLPSNGLKIQLMERI